VTHSRVPSTVRALVVLCAAVLALPACASGHLLGAASSPYSSGQAVTVQGTVADGGGRPLPDLKVTLEASRLGFSVYPWGTHKREVVTGSAQTSPRGDYGLEFPWNDLYNHFELVVAIPVATPQGDDLQELSRQDITRRVLQGSPVAIPVTLTDTAFLDTLRQFLASLKTAEEQKAYHQAGKPDRVDRTSYPDHVETAWWYFTQGKVYRFRDGHLESVDSFAPVQPVY
jgi:hypothetical protein